MAQSTLPSTLLPKSSAPLNIKSKERALLGMRLGYAVRSLDPEGIASLELSKVRLEKGWR